MITILLYIVLLVFPVWWLTRYIFKLFLSPLTAKWLAHGFTLLFLSAVGTSWLMRHFGVANLDQLWLVSMCSVLFSLNVASSAKSVGNLGFR